MVTEYQHDVYFISRHSQHLSSVVTHYCYLYRVEVERTVWQKTVAKYTINKLHYLTKTAIYEFNNA